MNRFREFNEREEYLAWQTAVVCKLWLDGKAAEAMLLSESVRRFISRVIPNPSEFESGLLFFNEGLVLVSEMDVINDYVWVTEREDFPTPAWPLIVEREDGKNFLVRLILRRCRMCGLDACECYRLDDCDRVEIQSEIVGDQSAFRELCRLYLSWFFSERALKAGIGPRTEVNEAYLQMRRELETFLTPIKPKSRAEMRAEREKVKRRGAKHQEAVESLLKEVAKFYEEEIPKTLEKEIVSFEEKWKHAGLRGMTLKQEVTIWELWDFVESLDIVFSDVSKLLDKAGREREHDDAAKLLAEAKKYLDGAIAHLVPKEEEWRWTRARRFSNVTSDQSRLRTALEELRKVNEILYNNRRAIGLVAVERGASRHSFWFEADLVRLARAVWGLEKYLAEKTS